MALGGDFWVIITIIKAVIEALCKLFGEPDQVAKSLKNPDKQTEMKA